MCGISGAYSADHGETSFATGDPFPETGRRPSNKTSSLTTAVDRGTYQSRGFLEEFCGWPIQADTLGVDRAFRQILSTAREQNLSAYAACLELAIRGGLPLAALDDDLRKTAKAVGVKIAATK